MPPSRHALPAGRHKTGTAVRRTLQCGGRPFFSVSPAYAGQKFLPPGIPLGTKFGAEPRTRRKAARTLSAPNFPVCVPTVRACRPVGTFFDNLFFSGVFLTLRRRNASPIRPGSAQVRAARADAAGRGIGRAGQCGLRPRSGTPPGSGTQTRSPQRGSAAPVPSAAVRRVMPAACWKSGRNTLPFVPSSRAWRGSSCPMVWTDTASQPSGQTSRSRL